MKKRGNYDHSSYFYAKKHFSVVKNSYRDADDEIQLRGESETRAAYRARKLAISRSDALPFGVVELARTSACIDMMYSRNEEVAYWGLRGLIPALIVDFAVAMKRDVKRIRNRVFREKYKAELQKQIAILRRDERAKREKERRQERARERRRIRPHQTLAPMPTVEEIRDAWAHRKDSHAAIIRLGGLLQTLECSVDNRLKINEYGRIIGRHGGIHSWIRACVPELAPHYKTLMRYKQIVTKLRQVANIREPMPTASIYCQKPAPSVLFDSFATFKKSFASLARVVEDHLGRSPQEENENTVCSNLNEAKEMVFSDETFAIISDISENWYSENRDSGNWYSENWYSMRTMRTLFAFCSAT